MSELEFNLEEAALEITQAIFDKQKNVTINGQSYPVIILGRTGLHSVSAGGYQFIEQNPKKDSKWAKLGQEGHEILWLFKGRKYIAQVMDNNFTLLGKKKQTE